MCFTLFLAIITAAFVSPAKAGTIFDYFEGGFWGTSAYKADLRCAVNPIQIRFSPNKQRAMFSLFSPIEDHNGQTIKTANYDIITHNETEITMALEGETRLTLFGNPVVWVLRKRDFDKYCWGRTDWYADKCFHFHTRCPQSMLLG